MYSNKAFWAPNLGLFIISRIISRYFANKRIRGWWFQIWQYFFQIPVQKIQYYTFLVPSLDIFGGVFREICN